MKRILASLLAFALLSALSVSAGAEGAAITSGDYQYSLTSQGTAVITRYLGTDTEPQIPETLGGKAVTRVGESAFRDCGGLVKVRVPDNVETIGAQAFYNCAALSDLTLPLSLREIGDLAFAYCGSLASVILLDGVERIGEFAFGECQKLSVITIPESVSDIGPDAFFGMDTGVLSGIFAREGSFAQEYAQANRIRFFPLKTKTEPNQTAVDEPAKPVAEDQPETIAEDDPQNGLDVVSKTNGDIITAEYTVRFPVGDRKGTYQGEMRDGVPHGQGSFTAINPVGISWTYQGVWENGAMNGLGTMDWTDGFGFRGYYRDNQPYQGEWLINGAVVYHGGFMMCAECGVSCFEGAGTLSDRTGQTIYEGIFESGLLNETDQDRAARAQGLDPQCVEFNADEYAAVMNAGSASGKLVKLQGRVTDVIASEDHGYGEFILSNTSSGGSPINFCYRFGKGEARAQVGNLLTLWGVAVGVYRDTDRRGEERHMPQLDAHVVALIAEQPVAGTDEVILSANKELLGRPLKNREFSFALDSSVTVIEERINPLDGTVTFVPITYTTQLQTKANNLEGVILFDPVRFEPEDIGGIYTYTITEIPGVELGMVYDPMVLEVTALVTDAGDGTALAQVFYPNDVIFNNSCLPQSVWVTLEARKELQGRELRDGEFSFQLIENYETLQTTSSSAGGIIVFESIEYTAADIGQTFLYAITETPGTEPGVEYDPSAIAVEVVVWDTGDGTPAATVNYSADTTFNNLFWAEGTADISLSVTLEGRALKNGEFSFSLSGDDIVLDTTRNSRDGTISFSPITYTQADIGMSYKYTISQIFGTESGMTYDPMAVSVTVSIILDDMDALAANVQYPNDPVFNNRFVQQTTTPLLQSVNTDKTTMKPGESVAWMPVVSQGTKPYEYHYELIKDGDLFKDIGWHSNASRISKLNTPGVWQMQVTVRDANGKLSETVLSPEVTLTKPALSSMDLNGVWNITHVITNKTGKNVTTPIGSASSYTWTIQMKDEKSGAFISDWKVFSGITGTIDYSNGTFKAVIKSQWQTDTYEGKMEEIDGSITLSGNRVGKREDGTYYATWTATKAE